jgi:FAD/FMN-containing dehydrogenase
LSASRPSSGRPITDPDAQAPYLIEMRDMFAGRTPLVLRPGSVEEVSQILHLANETATAIVSQGGNTGHKSP